MAWVAPRSWSEDDSARDESRDHSWTLQKPRSIPAADASTFRERTARRTDRSVLAHRAADMTLRFRLCSRKKSSRKLSNLVCLSSNQRIRPSDNSHEASQFG